MNAVSESNREKARRMTSCKVDWKQIRESLESHSKDSGHYEKHKQLLQVKGHESKMISTQLFAWEGLFPYFAAFNYLCKKKKRDEHTKRV